MRGTTLKLRVTFLTAVAVALTATPAQAAVLNANKDCYREGDPTDPVIFAGGPFTPGGTVNVSRDGEPIGTLQANSAGAVSGLLSRAPIIDPRKQRPFTLVATDQANPALTGTLTRLVSQLQVTVRPAGGQPGARRRINARGFTQGGTLYAHVVRRGGRRDVRIGRLAGPCGTLTARKRIFRRRPKNGTYRVQFDTSRAYLRRTRPSLAFRVRIFTVSRPRSGAASAAQRWVKID